MGLHHVEEIRFVQVEPTTRCNFSCGFCCGRKMVQRDMALEDFYRVCDVFPNVRHVELQGEGEPLLHPEFFTMARIARSRAIRLSMITNGSLLSIKDTVPQLLDAEFEQVSVSIESADAEQFMRIRGGKLDCVIAGISMLIDERNRRGSTRPVIGLAITVLESTVDSFPSIIALYQKLRLDGGITTQLLQRMESYINTYHAAMLKELVSEQSAQRFKQLRRAGKEELGASVGQGFYNELYSPADPGAIGCQWLERGVFVNADGDLSPCPKIKDIKRHGYGSIFSLERMSAVRSEMRDSLCVGKIPPPCTGCPEAERCRDQYHMAGTPGKGVS